MPKKLPDHVKVRSAIVLRTIAMIQDQSEKCARCDGEGYVDRDDWIVTESDGRRICYRCKGKGYKEIQYAHPIRVRYAVAKRIAPLALSGGVHSLLDLEEKAVEDVYWPILEDVYARAIKRATEVQEKNVVGILNEVDREVERNKK